MFRKKKYKYALEEILRQITDKYSMKIIELSITSDHIHIVVKCKSTISPSKALQLLKGISAYELFKRYPKLRLRYPKGHLWSIGKSCKTVGEVSLDTVRDYVKAHNEQQNNLTNYLGYSGL